MWLGWYGQSCGSSKVNADFDSIGDGNRSNFFHLSCSAFEVDVTFKDSHFPIIPSLRSLSARRSSAADTKMFVGKSDWSWNFNSLSFGVANELVGDLLDSIELVAAEGDSSSLDFLVFNSLFFGVLISHLWFRFNL